MIKKGGKEKEEPKTQIQLICEKGDASKNKAAAEKD